MTSHLLLLVVFAVTVASVLSTIQRDAVRDQLRLAAWLAAGFLGVALVLGWLMYPFPV
jgi:hypothetical protein